jgi:hypothetical protein
MLASYMQIAADNGELEKLQAILSTGVGDVGGGTAALINLLDCDNFEAFELIDASDAGSLAKYYDRENSEKPDGVSFEDYGKQCVKEEGGAFTQWGYIKFKHKEVSPEYTGVVPKSYRITGLALQALRFSKPERGGSSEKPSVMAAIKAAQKTPRKPRKDASSKRKNKGVPDL